MNPLLSIVIPVLNDHEEVNLTIQSIRQTAGYDVEVIVIDDSSDPPVVLKDRRSILHRTPERIGAGASKHLGATFATAEHVLLLDSHMRFEPHWLNKALYQIVGKPNVIHCAQCLGLSEGNMDITKFQGAYHGATLCIYEPANGDLLMGKWAGEKPHEDNYPIACLMGAAYFVPKTFFLKLRGMRGLKMWGTEEEFLSLKTWLAGGEVRLMKSVRIGHKFRSAAPYTTQVPYLLYNKIRTIKTVFDPILGNFLINKLPKNTDFDIAMKYIEKDQTVIEDDINYFRGPNGIFVNDVYWYADKFQIKLPDVGSVPKDKPIPVSTKTLSFSSLFLDV